MSDHSTDGPTEPAVRIDQLRLVVGGRTLLVDASARVAAGEVVLILGPSGAGKSTLLRLLAGLVDAEQTEIVAEGSICLHGHELLDFIDDGDSVIDCKPGTPAPRVGVVFQSFALFDEWSPLENVRFAVDHRTKTDAAEAGLAERLLYELGVPQDRRTANLSGGQRQRLAIARTLAYDPQVVLYDEPTSGLDSATAAQVAKLIAGAHAAHRKTSIIVTHDYGSLAAIADRIYLLDALRQTLRELPRESWPGIAEELRQSTASVEVPVEAVVAPASLAARSVEVFADSLLQTSRIVEQVVLLPLRLVPRWASVRWGLRFGVHYLRLVAGWSAWVYLIVAGLIIGFVTTYFTLKFLPFRSYTEPLVIEDLLAAIGFALFRILAPVFATILIAARCGAAVASDVGSKVYGRQWDALRTLGAPPERYLLTGILYAFLLGTPALVAACFVSARLVSVLVFSANYPQLGPFFWESHFFRELQLPGQMLYVGTGWWLAKLLCCAAGSGLIAYHCGRQPKYSATDVSRGITTTILWGTLYVLLVHFAFAFWEFPQR